MSSMLLLAILLSLGGPTSATGRWSGTLVDARCYAISERNVNKSGAWDFDRAWVLRMCRPTEHAKSFAVVQVDGESFTLDPAGSGKAADLVHSAVQKRYLDVMVTGEMSKNTVKKVDSISLVK